MKTNQDCPCNKDNGDCTKRHINCHSDCQDYKDWRAELDELNEVKNRESDYNAYRIQFILKRSKEKNEKSRFRRRYSKSD